MPIFDPLLVRRSVRSSTLAPRRAVVAPARTERANSAQRVARRRFSAACVGVERMAREEEADGVELALELLRLGPRARR